MDTPTIKLIRSARRGRAEAIDRLLRIVRDEHMPSRLYRYRGRNVLIDDDTLESEFLLGAFLAIGRVDPDKGNPLLYLLWRGQMRVASYCRSSVTQGIVASCVCGFEGPPGYERGQVRCKECGSGRVQTRMRVISMQGAVQDDEDGLPDSFAERMTLDEVEIEKDLMFDRATHAVAVEEMRARLTGRRLELFDLLVTEGVNGETSRNYLKEIAGRWGVSPQRVSQYLKDLRQAILSYYED